MGHTHGGDIPTKGHTHEGDKHIQGRTYIGTYTWRVTRGRTYTQRGHTHGRAIHLEGHKRGWVDYA